MTRTRPTMPSPALLAEWDEVHNWIRGRLTRYLRGLAVSERTCEYVGGLRLYLRAPFLLTGWVADRRLRHELTYDLAMHVVAMKLFDDLLDADTTLDRYELGGCLPLWHVAVESLCRRARDPRALLRVARDDVLAFSTGQLHTKREPAQDLPQWRAHAETYGGRFLGCYGSMAALAGDCPGAYQAATRLGHAFGMIVTVADDLRDYHRRGERAGNLGYLLRTGAASTEALVGLVEKLRAHGREAAAHPGAVHDVAPVVDWYADDVIHRMLPETGAA